MVPEREVNSLFSKTSFLFYTTILGSDLINTFSNILVLNPVWCIGFGVGDNPDILHKSLVLAKILKARWYELLRKWKGVVFASKPANGIAKLVIVLNCFGESRSSALNAFKGLLMKTSALDSRISKLKARYSDLKLLTHTESRALTA